MSALLSPFLLLSALGFLLSVTAHVLSLFGQVPPGGSLVMGLHAGIFVVWIPTVLVANRAMKGVWQKDFWKVILSGCPVWMRNAIKGIFAYAILNFILFAIETGGQHHGAGPLTAETVRGFSGHWMVFYAMAFATLYSVRNSPQLLRDNKCPKGHEISPADKFCPTCGTPLPKVIDV